MTAKNNITKENFVDIAFGAEQHELEMLFEIVLSIY
jgi:hypothetical protein